MAFDIDEFGAGPADEVQSSQGVLYVYPPGQISVGRFKALSQLPPEEKGAKLFAWLVSQVKRERFSDGDPQPLPPAVNEALTEDDRLRVADAMLTVVQKDRDTAEGAEAAEPIAPREGGESAYSYLARIADVEFARQTARLRATVDRAMKGLGSTVSEAFKHLNATSDRVGSTLAHFDRLNRATAPPVDLPADMGGFQARMAQEHQETRERAELTSQMTADSARMLTQLVEASQQFMAQLEKRDREDAKNVRSQLRYALISLVLGVFLSAASAWYAKVTYAHDLDKDKIDDIAAKAATQREERVTKALEQNASLLQLNAQLLDQLRATNARLTALESPPASAAKHKAAANQPARPKR
ncbi:hypothetical protein [Ideonella sp.]|uniref:hypothetical protein n=1 Tax=Ideonella sp. TaxID=1929293 RepID=UPI0035AD7A46